jgi:uracil-DNA glycosylase
MRSLMPWRTTVGDPLRRYLAAQGDLGGDEVMFDEPVQLPVARKAVTPRPAVIEARLAKVAEPVAAPAVRRPVANAMDGNATGWRKGAPAIPGPGLRVNAPSRLHESESLEGIAAIIAECRGCPLCAGRTKTVPGEGNPAARLMLIGEGPGETEDLTGRPFVGRAGELLDKILESIETPRPTVFIANVVKCRPPRNRAPLPDERAACLPYLHRQIALVRPKVLLALGTTAAEAMLGVKKPLGELRLRVHQWNGIPLIVTYHPAALLRNPNWKRPAWDDVRIARQLLDIDD